MPPRNRKLTRTDESRVKSFIRAESSTLPREDRKKVSGDRPIWVRTSLTKSSRPICGEIMATIVLPAPSTKTRKAFLLKTGHFTQAENVFLFPAMQRGRPSCTPSSNPERARFPRKAQKATVPEDGKEKIVLQMASDLCLS